MKKTKRFIAVALSIALALSMITVELQLVNADSSIDVSLNETEESNEDDRIVDETEESSEDDKIVDETEESSEDDEIADKEEPTDDENISSGGELTDDENISSGGEVSGDDESKKTVKLKDSFLTSTIKDYTYTGKPITQKIVLKDGKKRLLEDIDYVVEYIDNKNVGTAYVLISGIGDYSDSIIKVFKIKQKAVKNPKISIKRSKYRYTGRSIKPYVSVTYGSRYLKQGSDYKVTYSNNIKPGKATITIQFKNNYSGKAKKTFTIIPTKVVGQKQMNCSTNVLTIRWKKQEGVSGYEVYRAYSKNGTYTKVKTIKDYSNTFKNRKLEPATTYYYKVRSYKLIDGSYSYGEFSNIFSATTKPQTTTIRGVAGEKRAGIAWTSVPGVDGYEIYMATKRNGNYKSIGVRNSKAVHVVKTGLKSKQKYYFKVKAYRRTPVGKKVYAGVSNIISIKVR